MRSHAFLLIALALATPSAQCEIRRDPNGVNVNAQGATSVFITFGGLDGQVPAEALWCGALVDAAPDVGQRCEPGTIFGSLPARYDRSTRAGSVFTDVMSIPPSVARRAYQDAERGATSSFYYVRRFVRPSGGRDEYVFVTCRMAGGGARVPLALVDVTVAFAGGDLLLELPAGKTPPRLEADIAYNGTGRLRGRWEVALPGDEPPDARDLLPEASLPVSERGTQRRYTELSRFNVFLPPTGRVTLPGPDPGALPRSAEGMHMILLRIEASDDKEAQSDLGKAGAGTGIVWAGGVAGFPMPPLRYVVTGGEPVPPRRERPELLVPEENATLAARSKVSFRFAGVAGADFYRLEVETVRGEGVVSAVLQGSTTSYDAPPFLAEHAGAAALRWRVVVLRRDGSRGAATEWRSLRILKAVP